MMLNMYSTEKHERNLHSIIQSKGKKIIIMSRIIMTTVPIRLNSERDRIQNRSYVLTVVQLVSQGGQCSSQCPIAVLGDILLIASRMLIREQLDIMVQELLMAWPVCYFSPTSSLVKKNSPQQQTIQLIAVLQP